MPTEAELKAEINGYGPELTRRADLSKTLSEYYTGDCVIPQAVVKAQMTNAYRLLMGMAQAPWGALVVDSVQDRLEVAGIRSSVQEVDDAVWGVWQDNDMDGESKLAHNAALTDGRCFATVWRGDDGQPEIVLDSMEQVIVRYREGSRRHRAGALRYWIEDKRPHVTLYRPDGIYKFIGPKDVTGIEGVAWQRREAESEDWPLKNPLGVIPVVELAVNRRLRAGEWPYARGEFAHARGLIDRMNLLTFLGLVVALWMGFPLRGVIGEKIRERVLVDDNGDPITGTDGKAKKELVPPFDANADSVFQLENPQAKLASYEAADRKNLSIYPELDQFATVTGTPRHYLPMEHGMSNLSADAIRASEGPLHAKVPSHKSSLGGGWEEVLRLAGRMLDQPVELSQRAELLWVDHESRSLAERADAASKLAEVLPWQALAEKVLNATQDEIGRWQSMRAADPLARLFAAAQERPGLPVAA